MKEYILSPENLDSLYHQWLRLVATDRFIPRYTKYKHVSRGAYGSSQRFEDWLWDHKFSVFQKNKKRYAKFVGSEKELTLFLLKSNL
jgi:hypothetical protein